MNNYLIYKIKWDEGFYYVGRTKNLKTRLKEHLKRCKAHKQADKYQNVFNLYDKWDTVEVIKSNLSINDAIKFEKEQLNACFGTEWCVNAANSIAGVNIMSDGTKAKIGNANKGNKHTAETKALISAANRGQVPWNKGIPRTAETKALISAALKGNKHTAETKEKIRQGNLGKKLTAETKTLISAALKGKKRKPLTAEHKRNLSLAQKKRWAKRKAKEK